MKKGDKYTFGENEKQIMRILDSFEQELDNLQKGFNFSGLIIECQTKMEVLQELLESENK